MRQLVARWLIGLPRFFADLKRRRVFRVLAWYGAAAFATLQAIELLEPILPLPPSLYRAAGIVLIFGLPIAGALSWLYDYDHGLVRTAPATPEELDALVHMPRIRRWASGLLALGGLALLVLTGWYAVRSGSGRTARDDPRPSLAILPFSNRSAVADDAFFVEGLHDDILVQLSRVKSLRVISRTSVLRFRGSDLPLPVIADSLGVAAVLEGAVQRSGTRVRVSMQLIDAQTERHLWGERWDEELTPANVLSIQLALAVDIAKALQVSLAPEEEERIGSPRTEDLEAYDAFLLAQSRWSQLTLDGTQQAVTLFREAVARDPRFAEARAGLAAAQATLATFRARGRAATSLFGEAEAEADRALALKPGLAYAEMAKGIAALGARQDPAEADRHFNAALERRPGDPAVRLWHARALMTFGRFQEAVEASRETLLLDPLSGLAHAQLGLALWGLGFRADADTALKRATDLDPRYVFGHMERAVLLTQREEEREAGREMVAFGRALGYPRADALTVIPSAAFHARLRREALAALDSLLAGTPLEETDVIPLLVLVGATGRAAAATSAARKLGSPWLPFFEHPLFGSPPQRTSTPRATATPAPASVAPRLSR